ncbi:MAG TPA: hypothetical protein VMF13_21635, partial [Luteitalea sp.]|nr:hypothetical protein [Luteitalea sp.]
AIDRLSIVDNRTGLFPIHRSMRIVAMTGTSGASTDAFVIDDGAISGPATTRASRGKGRPERSSPPPVTTNARIVTRALLRLLGAAEAIPDIRHDKDLHVLAVLAAAPALGGDEWQLRFGRELNATEDAASLRRRPGTERIAVVDGKHVSAFAVRQADDGRWIAASDAHERLAHQPWRRWRLAYRDVSSPTNTRSLIAALLPPGCVSTHTLFCLRTPTSLRRQLYLCGMLNSLVADWFVRRFLGSHVTTRLIASVRVPSAHWSNPTCRVVARLTLRLMRDPADEEAQARLHRAAADLYGLSTDDLAHIADDFPRLSPLVRAGMLRA